jgi:hypothetical protein
VFHVFYIFIVTMHLYLHPFIVSDTCIVPNIMGLYVYGTFFLFEVPPMVNHDSAFKSSCGDLQFLAMKLAHYYHIILQDFS